MAVTLDKTRVYTAYGRTLEPIESWYTECAEVEQEWHLPATLDHLDAFERVAKTWESYGIELVSLSEK